MLPTHSPKQNRLLATLAPRDFAPLSEQLELVALRLGEVLYEPGGQLQHAYFPTSAIVSLHYVSASGESSEIAGVGNEGVVGISLFMGGDTTPSSASVRSAGHAYRLPRRFLREQFDRPGPMLELLLRYTQALIVQMTQNAVCNRHHTVAQQLCRWLLMTLDRVPSGPVTMTQELVANTLGVRREGITVAASQLREAGVISYRRGHITVVRRAELELRSCECYTAVKSAFDRLLPAMPYDEPLHLRSGAPIDSMRA